MGYEVEKRRFGFYQRQKDTGRARATVRHLPVGEIPNFIEDLRRYSGGEEIRFYVDDRELDDRIDPPSPRTGASSRGRRRSWPTPEEHRRGHPNPKT